MKTNSDLLQTSTSKTKVGDPRKELINAIDGMAKRGGVSRDRAVTAWYAATLLGIDEDDAIDAASVDGPEDAGCDFIYIDDIIDGLIILAFSEPEKIIGDIVNLGTGVQTSNLEVYKNFEKIFNKKLAYQKTDSLRNFDSNSWVCNPQYAKDKYGFECKYNLEMGLLKYAKGN